MRDIARQVGTFEWPVQSLAHVAVPAVHDDPGDRHRHRGRLRARLTHVGHGPAGLTYTVNGTGDARGFKIQACNRGGAEIAGATYLFNYAVLGY